MVSATRPRVSNPPRLPGFESEAPLVTAAWFGFTRKLLCEQGWPILNPGSELEVDPFCTWLDGHGLLPLVVWKAQAAQDACTLAREIFEKGQKNLEDAVVVDLFKEKELRAFTSLLREHRVRFVLLKGVALQRVLYPEPYLRSRGDLDVFIAEEDAPRVHHLLRKSGYRQKNPDGHAFLSCAFDYRRQSLWGSTDYDIHWRCHSGRKFREALSFERVYEQAVALDGFDRSIPRARSTDLLLHGCIKLAGGDVLDSTLRPLLELCALAEKLDETDFMTFAADAEASRVDEDCRLALSLAYLTFDCLPQRASITGWIGDYLNETPDSVRDKLISRHRRECRTSRLRDQATLLSKLGFILEEFLPNPRYVRNNMAAPLVSYPGIYWRRLVKGLWPNVSRTFRNE